MRVRLVLRSRGAECFRQQRTKEWEQQAKYLEVGKRSIAGESIMALMRNFD